jgi:catechol 2,3-dioxygenase-like lactoylglutathione lyase family enzyme
MMRVQPAIASTEAHLFVADIAASCDFYAGKLGFAVALTYGDPPFFAQVKREEAKLNLRVVGEPVFAGDVREREALLSVSFTLATVEETERLFSVYEAAGVPFAQIVRKELWGATTFIVRDPDGNRILFAGPA